ncbi:MAG: helicase-related protein, partial [Chitinivibrionales bacterium]|nr:helicase-related protein [Chitinivibrionales bacterium]
MPPLPILEYRETIATALQNGKNIIVAAPTGSGKSTQVPQVLLQSGLFDKTILVLQPRRIAARMLATRVAYERGSALGEEIGFQTRFERLISEHTRICFITEGILPRMALSDKNLSGVSAVIFDEFHERSLACDFGLGLLSDLQRTHRPDLRLIVMSATIDVAPVKEYLGDCEVIESAGRVYPIDIRYLAGNASTPPWDAATAAVKTLLGEGAEGDLLVFMPGAYEIRRTIERIGELVRGEAITAIPLYGDLPAAAQQRVMERSAGRKIIVATNIAETSLTIPGVRHVIDSGLARVNRFDAARGFNTLFTESISVDAADQRAGRAGREAPGICLRLWGRSSQEGRARRTTPEVLRVDLADTALALHQLGYTDQTAFPWFEPPSSAALQSAHELLALLGALDDNGNLTGLGREM